MKPTLDTLQNEELLSVKAVARILGMSRSWVYMNMHSFAYIKVGGTYLVVRSSVEEYIQNHVHIPDCSECHEAGL